MDCNYSISETKRCNLELYRLCFSQNNFCEDYGISIPQNEFNGRVSEIALAPYKDVTRFILNYKECPISFCHFLFKSDVATASGGILPELANTGKGVFAAAIFYHFYFSKFSVAALVVEIEKNNLRSIRMHKALGFVEIEDRDKVKLQLQVENFPNDFTKQVLSKLRYEYK